MFSTKDDFIKTKESLIALGLSERSQNALLNSGISCLGDLLKLSYRNLVHINNLGKKSICEIQESTKELNIDELIDLVERSRKSKIRITNRQEMILDMWNSAEHTYESIGEIIGVSRERIRQILVNLKRKGFDLISIKEAGRGRRANYLNEQSDFIDDDKFIKMFHLGHSQEEICNKFLINNDVYEHHKNYLSAKGVISNKKRILDTIKFDIENVDEITRNRENVIIKMRKENYKLEDIAEALAISKIRLTQVIKTMKDKGYTIPNSRMSGKPLSEEEIISRVNKIDYCLDKGMNIRQISHVININPHVIKALVYKHLVNCK